jgi:hypothetical protein
MILIRCQIISLTSIGLISTKKEKGAVPLDTTPLRFKIPQPPIRYFTTFTFTVVFKFSYLNLTFAFPFLFLAVIVNVALPLASVEALSGDTDMRFLSDLLTFAVTISPSSGGQPSVGINVTTTSALSPLLSSSSLGEADIDSVSHSADVGIGVGVAVCVATGVGVDEGVTVAVVVGVAETVGVGATIVICAVVV